MSVVNVFDGSVFLSPDLPAGYGTTISAPGTQLSDMIAGGIYFREIGNESDVVLLNVEGYFVSMYKSLSNQRLMQQFAARMTSIGIQNKIRWVHRSLALSLSFEAALKSVGENVTVSDDWSNLTQINQQLAGRYIAVWASP